MDVTLLTAGVITVALGTGHETLGRVWVLPRLVADAMPKTPFGPKSMTRSMILVSWHIVTIFAIATGGLLISIAWAPSADPKTLLLRWFAVMWIGAAVMAGVVAGLSPRKIMRLPVPLIWIVVAVLLWVAST